MHPIKRVFLIGLFSFGTIAGFGHGFAHLGWAAGSCHSSRRAAFEDRVADVCTRSAERVWQEGHAVSAPGPAVGSTLTIAMPTTLTIGVAPAALAPAALAPAVASPATLAPVAAVPVEAPATP